MTKKKSCSREGCKTDHSIQWCCCKNPSAPGYAHYEKGGCVPLSVSHVCPQHVHDPEICRLCSAIHFVGWEENVWRLIISLALLLTILGTALDINYRGNQVARFVDEQENYSRVAQFTMAEKKYLSFSWDQKKYWQSKCQRAWTILSKQRNRSGAEKAFEVLDQ